MEDNTKDFLGKYKGKPYPPLEKRENLIPKLIKEEAEYKAFEEFRNNRRSARFRIIDADGKSYGCSYAHLLDWVFNPPTLLTITTATRIFTFEGNHLERIEQLLMEDKIKELWVFNAVRHKKPANNKAIIEELTIIEQT